MRLAAIVWAVAWGIFGLPWDGSLQELHGTGPLWTTLPMTKRHVADAALNFLFYVPLGVLLRASGRSVTQALVIGVALSLTTEALQFFSPTRVPSVPDLALNTAGVGLGLVLSARATAPAR